MPWRYYRYAAQFHLYSCSIEERRLAPGYSHTPVKSRCLPEAEDHGKLQVTQTCFETVEKTPSPCKHGPPTCIAIDC